MSDSSKMSAKRILRRELNQVLKNLSKEEITRQSDIVTRKVLQNEDFKKAKVVSLYLSMDNEIQTEALLSEIFKQHKQCFIPRFLPGQPEMEMVKLSSLKDYYSLPINKWNIKQHADDEVIESVFDSGKLDLVFVPGLAFTQDGKRLGRGKGYYDRFFAKCSKELENFPITLGLAFKEQMISNIPVTEHDFSVDKVIYDDQS